MLVIPAHCHDGHIDLDRHGRSDIPAEADVVVVFLPKARSLRHDGEVSPEGVDNCLSAEQRAACCVQSMSGFAQTDLLDPAEDVWNHV